MTQTLRTIAHTQTTGCRTVGLPGITDRSPTVQLSSFDGTWSLTLPRALFNFPVDIEVMAVVTLMAVVVEEVAEKPKGGLILPGKPN